MVDKRNSSMANHPSAIKQMTGESEAIYLVPASRLPNKQRPSRILLVFQDE